MRTTFTSLRGKVGVVTGSSRGIGRAIAERLAADGASVVVNYRENGAKARDVVAAIEAGGGRAHAVMADIGDAGQVSDLFQRTVELFGRVDIVVANAGIARWGALAEVTEDDYQAVFEVNTKGTFLVLREAARRIEDGGRIINVTSASTQMTLPGLALYSGSKAAGELFARTLAKELAARNVTVNSVSPGYTDTDMLPEDPDFRKLAAQLSFFGRLGEPAEIADVVAFLASDEARWLTGQVIQAGGGIVTA